jgi:multiple sugar transport system permease protein
MLSNSRLYPFTVGLTTWYNTAQQYSSTRQLFNLIVTCSLLVIIPLIVAFVLLHRFWRGGASTGSLK